MCVLFFDIVVSTSNGWERGKGPVDGLGFRYMMAGTFYMVPETLIHNGFGFVGRRTPFVDSGGRRTPSVDSRRRRTPSVEADLA